MDSGISVKTMLHHVDFLTGPCKYRFSGTVQQKAAAQYVFDQLVSYGIDVRMNEFFGYGSIPLKGSLETVFPRQQSIACEVVAYSQDLDDRTYSLVDLGAGTEEDFNHRDLSGTIVLLNAFEGPGTPEKARMAQKRGAAGIILVTWPAPRKGIVTYRAFKGVWGNPDRSTFAEIPSLCAVSVSYESGLALRRMVLDGPVTVRMRGQCDTGWVKLYEPVATVRAAKPTEDFVMVTGHVDAWAEGATDNASGVALMLELARYFHQHCDLLRRNLVFAFYDGHEILEATGSSCIAESMWDEIRGHGIMELNIDSPGLVGTNGYVTFCNFELMDFLQRVHREMGLACHVKMLPITRDSDRSFLALGLPGFLTVEDGISENSEIPFSWWCHTSEDTADKLDPKTLARTSEIFVRYLLEFAGSDAIPFSAERPVRLFSQSLRDAVEACGEKLSGIDFSTVIRGMDSLAALCAQLDRKRSEAPGRLLPMYRRLFQKMAPVFYTVSGRYRQDNYGDVRYAQAVPLLEPLRKLAREQIDSEEYYLLYTECIRIRNMISDFLTVSEEIQSAVQTA